MSLTTGIVSYWKLDESSGNAADSVASNTLINTNSVTYNAGLINNGADFGSTNTNKKLSIASGLGIGSGDYSVSWWFKNGGSDLDFDGLMEFGTGSNRVMAFRNGNNNRWWVFAQGGGNDVLTESISNNTWYNLILTRTGGTCVLYVNGVSKITVSSLGSNTTQVFNLGTSDANAWFGTNKIDEVGVWSRVLTGAEMTELYNGGAGKSYPFTNANTTNFFNLM